MAEPELRCLECNLLLADFTADADIERCRQCERFVLANQPTKGESSSPVPMIDLIPDTQGDDGDAIPLVQPKVVNTEDDIPLAQPVATAKAKPAITDLPSWARPSTATTQANPSQKSEWKPNAFGSPKTELTLPETERPRPSLFMAFIVVVFFFVAVIVATGVLAYAIVSGLKLRALENSPNTKPAIVEPKEEKRGKGF